MTDPMARWGGLDAVPKREAGGEPERGEGEKEAERSRDGVREGRVQQHDLEEEERHLQTTPGGQLRSPLTVELANPASATPLPEYCQCRTTLGVRAAPLDRRHCVGCMTAVASQCGSGDSRI